MIGVIGFSARGAEGYLTQEILSAADHVGRQIASHGAVLVTGGGSGVMEAASRGASSAGGLAVGILPGLDKAAANAYVDIPIATGLHLARNFLTVRATDALVMVGGAVGTLNEVTHALMEAQTPVVVLEGTGGWADRIREIAVAGLYLDERRHMPLHFADTPETAVDQAIRLGRARYPL